jgi:uncharacterized protein (DUF1330 family)
MKHYAVAEIDITDPRWIPAYVEHTTRLVERHGGRYLARTGNFEKLEGEREPPQIYLIIEWPSKEAGEAFYECEEYRPYRDSRQHGSRGEFVLVAGEDASGAARM